MRFYLLGVLTTLAFAVFGAFLTREIESNGPPCTIDFYINDQTDGVWREWRFTADVDSLRGYKIDLPERQLRVYYTHSVDVFDFPVSEIDPIVGVERDPNNVGSLNYVTKSGRRIK